MPENTPGASSPIAPQSASTVAVDTPAPGGHILYVGAGEAFTSLSVALSAAQDNDVIAIKAGTYVDDSNSAHPDYVNAKNVTIEGVGGMAHIVAGSDYNDKSVIVAQYGLTVKNLEISGVTSSSNNGAGIRVASGNLTVEDCYIHDNQDGILGGGPGSKIVIDHTEFANNGAGDGQSHNVYIGNADSLVFTNNYTHNANAGHLLKSRAASNTIANNVIADQGGNSSYAIDLPNAGTAVIQNNIIEKGANSPNGYVIHYGGETQFSYPNNALLVTGNTILYDRPNHYGPVVVANMSGVTLGGPSVPVTVTGNSTYGLPGSDILYGAGTVSNTTSLASEPAVPTASPWANAPVITVAASAPPGGSSAPAGNPTPPVAVAAALASPAPAAAGPDTLSLNLSEDAYLGDAQFTVSVDGTQLSSTPQTVTALHGSGQTQAFTYSGNFGTGPHAVMVTFTNDAWGGTSSTDRNLYVNGVALDGNAPTAQSATYGDGVHSQTGTIELFSTGNTANFTIPGATPPSVPASTPAPSTPVTSAPIVANTPPASADTLTLGLSEDAWQGDAQFNVFVDGHQVNTAPQSVTASHAAGQSQVFTYTGTFGAGAHQVGISFINDAWGGTPSTDRNLYVDRVSMDGTSSPMDAGSVPIYSDGTAIFGAVSTAAPAAASGADTLTLNVSEDAWQGDAAFTIQVDGKTIGGTQMAFASHAAGQSQAYSITGNFGAGSHTVGVTFLNDAWGGTSSTDRNLYLDGVQFDGKTFLDTTQALYSNGSTSLAVNSAAAGLGTTPTYHSPSPAILLTLQ